MITRLLVIATVLSSLPSLAQIAKPADTPRALVANAQQLVVVTTASWAAKQGSLRRFERLGSGWSEVGVPVAVVVGTSGLGQGIDGGVAAAPDAPKKAEGDGRAPAGAFALTRVFGKASAPKSLLPSARTSPGLVCIDDVTHPAYNRVVDWPKTAVPAYRSAEQMVRKDALYDVVVVVDFNHAERDGAERGAGSCVFLHVWRGADKGTAGCTAMARASLDDVVAWLDASKHPVLVQLPADHYLRVEKDWALPLLARPR